MEEVAGNRPAPLRSSDGGGVPSGIANGSSDLSMEGSSLRSSLRLERFGAAYGDRVVLVDITLSWPERGVIAVVGPGSSGKSTLVRTVCGINASIVNFKTWGRVWYRDALLDVSNTAEDQGETSRPMLVAQKLRLLASTVARNAAMLFPDRHALSPREAAERVRDLLLHLGQDDLAARLEDQVVELSLGQQRRLALARLTPVDPAVVCLDEPTDGLEDQEADPLIDFIRAEGQRRCVVVVTHRLDHARRLAQGGRVLLIGGGRVLADQPTEEFFESPACPEAADYVRTGCCQVVAADADPDMLDPNQPPPPALPSEVQEIREQARRPGSIRPPSGFRWLHPGRLAGTSKPGLLVELEEDLAGLAGLGITTLVCLTAETPPIASNDLARHGIRGLTLPMPDMGAPRLEDGLTFLEDLKHRLDAGEVVALHCRGGLGRTGMMLAAYLIYQGASALEALERVRQVEPKYVQSLTQIAFLDELARRLGRDSNPICPVWEGDSRVALAE